MNLKLESLHHFYARTSVPSCNVMNTSHRNALSGFTRWELQQLLRRHRQRLRPPFHHSGRGPRDWDVSSAAAKVSWVVEIVLFSTPNSTSSASGDGARVPRNFNLHKLRLSSSESEGGSFAISNPSLSLPASDCSETGHARFATENLWVWGEEEAEEEESRNMSMAFFLVPLLPQWICVIASHTTHFLFQKQLSGSWVYSFKTCTNCSHMVKTWVLKCQACCTPSRKFRIVANTGS